MNLEKSVKFHIKSQILTNLEFVQDFFMGTVIKDSVCRGQETRKEMGGGGHEEVGRGLTKLMMYERVIWKPTIL